MVLNVDQLVEDITATRLFSRLRRVSFLGVVDWINALEHQEKSMFSRAEHSLGVLRLGYVVAREGRLPDEDVAHLLATCLVHDLGHPPFSHSLEYAFPKSLRLWNHHKVLGEILTEPTGQDREVVRVLLRHGVRPARVFSIVNGDDPLSFFFDSPLNLDTLDGISRSLWSLGNRPRYNVDTIARYMLSVYVGASVNSLELKENADRFWISKGAFYNFLGSGNRIAASERSFQAAVRRRVKGLDRSDFRMDDKQFLLRHPGILEEAAAASAAEDSVASQDFIVDGGVHVINKSTVYKRYRRIRHENSGHR